MAITWLGHATVLIELDGIRLITDPLVRHRVGPLVRIAPAIGVDVVGHVDCALLSHLHADHTDLRSLRDIARGAPVLAPYPAGNWLTRHGVREVRELSPGSQARVGGLLVTATAAVHDRRRRPLGPAADPIGYVIRGSSSTYFAGDTDVFSAMAELRGSIAVALLPVWGWGPRLGPGHLDPDRAAAVAALIGPGLAIPIHWGTYALGRPARRPADPERPAREFARLTRRYAPAVQVRILEPGERAELSPVALARTTE